MHTRSFSAAPAAMAMAMNTIIVLRIRFMAATLLHLHFVPERPLRGSYSDHRMTVGAGLNGQLRLPLPAFIAFAAAMIALACWHCPLRAAVLAADAARVRARSEHVAFLPASLHLR